MMLEEAFAGWLAESLPQLASRRVLLGFDGFEDRVVRLRGVGSMKELGEYLLARDGMSGALPYSQQACKMGGNMPIMGNALGTLGVACDCVGTLGEPKVEAVFSDISKNCGLHTVGQPGRCMALEFESGKLMLFSNEAADSLDFEGILKRLGKERFVDMHAAADLICYLNWSEMPGWTDILRGVTKEILPHLPERQRTVLFDLSDVTERAPDELREAVQMMGRVARFARTVLSLNENETIALYRLLNGSQPEALVDMTDAQVQAAMENVLSKVNVSILVVRGNRRVFALNADGDFAALSTLFVEVPRLITGAGDNFNAGIAAALLMGGDLRRSLALGTLVASHYIERGASASPEGLLTYLNQRRMGV